jgi:predicted transcriptional regulator
MTLTIQLPPDVERRLREKAIERGEAVEAVAAAVLADALAWDAQDAGDAVEGIRRGLEDFEAGRYRPFQEFADEQRRKHQLSGNG